jgi:type II secretory pathway pseudopilin PulG
MNYQCKAKQSEAKTNLGTIRTMQEAYRAEYDEYAVTLGAIGFETKGDTRYTYDPGGSGNTFTATATDKGDMNGDAWSIDQDGNLDNDPNGCK